MKFHCADLRCQIFLVSGDAIRLPRLRAKYFSGYWVINLYLAYAGDTQIELIQHVSGKSMFEESLERNDDAVQHVAYWLDDSECDAAARELESAGYPLIQCFKIPVARVGYFDTRPVIGVVTEIVGALKRDMYFDRT